MMYHEFIEKSNFTERYISYTEYTTYIEPIYMCADQIPTKQEFIKELYKIFETIVYPIVEKTINNFSIEDKLAFVNGNAALKERIEKVDFEARKLAYQYMKLALTI